MTDRRTRIVGEGYDTMANTLGGLFSRIRSWLVPGGLFTASLGTASLGTGDTDDWVGEWLGATMFFSSFPPDVSSRLLREAGFELERDEVVRARARTSCGAWRRSAAPGATLDARSRPAIAALECGTWHPRSDARNPQSVLSRALTIREPESEVQFQWVLARR